MSDFDLYDSHMSPDTADLLDYLHTTVDEVNYDTHNTIAGIGNDEHTNYSTEPGDLDTSDMTPGTANLVGNIDGMLYDINHEDLSGYTSAQLAELTREYNNEAGWLDAVNSGEQIIHNIDSGTDVAGRALGIEYGIGFYGPTD